LSTSLKTKSNFPGVFFTSSSAFPHLNVDALGYARLPEILLRSPGVFRIAVRIETVAFGPAARASQIVEYPMADPISKIRVAPESAPAASTT